MLSLKGVKVFLLALSILMIAVSYSYAQSIPQQINYNGTLTDVNGNPVPDGQYDVVFTVYDAMTNGNVLWTETWNSSTARVVVTNGNFNALLGAHNAIPTSFFTDHPTAYLGVKVGTDSEMLPRQKIVSVGYAFTAGNGIPKGGIIMWSGAIDSNGNPVINGISDTGWHICDGTNGTPNLRDRFVVGAGHSYNIDDIGGEKTHVLSVGEMPYHNHSVDPPLTSSYTQNQNHQHSLPWTTTLPEASGYGLPMSVKFQDRVAVTGEGSSSLDNNQNHYHNIDIGPFSSGSEGSGQAHENRPPYYALAFIMKL